MTRIPSRTTARTNGTQVQSRINNFPTRAREFWSSLERKMPAEQHEESATIMIRQPRQQFNVPEIRSFTEPPSEMCDLRLKPIVDWMGLNVNLGRLTKVKNCLGAVE